MVILLGSFGLIRSRLSGIRIRTPAVQIRVEAAKQRLTQRNYAHVFLKPVSGCCDLKRNRTSQAHLVSHNARISARRQKRKVIRNVLFGQLYRHFLCKKRTCNQADAPVDPPEHKRVKRKQQNGARILFFRGDCKA